MRGASRFRGESAVRTWLLGICRRKCAGHHRRRRLVIVPLETVGSDALIAAEHDPIDGYALRVAVQQLTDNQREAFLLVSVLGYPRVEAAEMIGVPASTMRSRHDSARKMLVEILERGPT